MPGVALGYVLTSREPVVARWGNAYTASTKMISRGELAPDVWRTESVDVARDYRALVGTAPTPVVGLGLMTDTDDRGGHATTWYADFRVTGRGA